VIGSKTAGAVLASLIVRLNDPVGYWIQYPLTDYVTIKGRRLEGNGVEVNIPAGVARFGEPDPGVVAAIRKLDELASSGG
jgi:carboxyl-terminal processing protease